MHPIKRTLGANLRADGYCEFRIWAPFLKHLVVEIIPQNKKAYRLDMHRNADGYFNLTVKNIQPKDRYYYCIDDEKIPDLAADYLPEGIDGPAEIIMKNQPHAWQGTPLASYIIYELHVGTYTPEGTFTAIIPHLPCLKELGITALELMPIAQFSGSRNWGYDGVFPFAVQNTYGGPDGLMQLINACHQLDIAVILDVVYNHIGPEGSYFQTYGPYFTDKYQTPWGKSLNFDDANNHHVRHYFIENALHWFTEYGIDALRLDAIHAIVDSSAYPFLEELADKVALLSVKMQRDYYLIAESSANDPRLIRSKKEYGFGLHAQWNDEFHHALHSLLTKEKGGYYQDFGTIDLFVKAYKEGYAYSGQYSCFRKKPHGRSSARLPAERFVVFMQNHDHIGNRLKGDRLTQTLSLAQLKFYAALLLFSPYVPLLFMGEEYGETAPFHYFVSHSEPNLIKAVREGRKKEFPDEYFSEETIDPQAENTFLTSKLNHDLKNSNKHRELWDFYKRLIDLRKSNPVLKTLSKHRMTLQLVDKQLLLITRKNKKQQMLLVANFSEHPLDYFPYFDCSQWRLILDSSDQNAMNSTIPSFGILIFERGPANE